MTVLTKLANLYGLHVLWPSVSWLESPMLKPQQCGSDLRDNDITPKTCSTNCSSISDCKDLLDRCAGPVFLSFGSCCVQMHARMSSCPVQVDPTHSPADRHLHQQRPHRRRTRRQHQHPQNRAKEHPRPQIQHAHQHTIQPHLHPPQHTNPQRLHPITHPHANRRQVHQRTTPQHLHPRPIRQRPLEAA